MQRMDQLPRLEGIHLIVLVCPSFPSFKQSCAHSVFFCRLPFLRTMYSFSVLSVLATAAVASPLSPDAANAGMVQGKTAAALGKPVSEGITTFDGVALSNIEAKPAREAMVANANPRSGWTCTADSSQQNFPCDNVLDGDTNTFWHTMYAPTVAPLPHSITLDMKSASTIGSISYTPRQDGNSNGRIGQHVISVR